MYVSGIAERDARRRRCAPRRRSARSLPFFSVAPWRVASSSTTSAPTLWRVRAYSSPGLPSPTTSRSAGVPRAPDAAAPATRSPASSDGLGVGRLAGSAPSPASPSSPSTASPSSSSVGDRAVPRPARRASSGSTCGGDAVGQREVAHVELVADRERRDVDLDRRPGCCPACASIVRVKSSCSSRPPSLHALGLADRGGAGPRRSTATSRRMRTKSTCTSVALASGGAGSGGRA